MGTIAEDQWAQSMPPRRGLVVALAVDSTARPYNLSTLAIGSPNAPQGSGKRREVVGLWMQAETNDVYFHFDSATSSGLADTAKIAAGGTMAYADTYGAVLKAGNPPILFRIDRAIDVFLIVKAASTAGVLRMWAASDAE